MSTCCFTVGGGGVKMFWTMFKYKHIFSYDGFKGSYHKKLKSGCFWTLSKTNSRFGKLGLARADVKTALKRKCP